MLKASIALSALLLCVAQLPAATYYLDATSGSDTTGDGSDVAPWASMARVFTVVQD